MLTPRTQVISLPDMEAIKSFVSIVSVFPQEMDLRVNRYVVDAKSILGIMSLGPQPAVSLDIYGEDPESVIEAIREFTVAE